MRVNLRAMAARALLLPAANAHQFGSQASDLRQEALQQLGTMLASDLDAALFTALDRFLGRPVRDHAELEELAGRIQQVTQVGVPGTTYVLDGTDLVWVGPIEVEQKGTKVVASQGIKQLVAPG